MNMHSDDELVYPVHVPDMISDPAAPVVPALNATREGVASPLCLNHCLLVVFGEALVDSGASHSFASAEFMRENCISYNHVSAPPAALGNESSLAIMGIAKKLAHEYRALVLKVL
jgi:hypothetical protein